MKKLLVIGIATTLFGLTSCEKFDDIVKVKDNNTTDKTKDTTNVNCTLEVRPGVTLYLMGEDGKPLQSFVEGKIVNVKTGKVEYLKVDDKQSLKPVNALHEKEGVYDIHLHSKGYKTVSLKDVKVDSDICHVKTVSLKAVFYKIDDAKKTDIKLVDSTKTIMKDSTYYDYVKK